MKVVDINSKRLFGQFYPPARERVPEGARFLAGTVLTLIAPTIMYCYVTNQTQPLYLMTIQLVMGALVGISLNKKKASHSRASCVPVTRVPGASHEVGAKEEDEDAA